MSLAKSFEIVYRPPLIPPRPSPFPSHNSCGYILFYDDVDVTLVLPHFIGLII